ncbi:MAG: hypothetical protein M1820_003492 [Bogoriella megaspora]|nr:MAG: hypothetical protein M1820_003492 [Bogoriella megaspora]
MPDRRVSLDTKQLLAISKKQSPDSLTDDALFEDVDPDAFGHDSKETSAPELEASETLMDDALFEGVGLDDLEEDSEKKQTVLTEIDAFSDPHNLLLT